MGFTQQLQTFNATDEWYTPKSAVEMILPYIKKQKTIWCPFDKPHSTGQIFSKIEVRNCHKNKPIKALTIT